MLPLAFELDPTRRLFVKQARGFLHAAQALTDLELLDPSQCRGWRRLDLVVHVRMGLDEMASTASVTTDRRADHDAASYWASHPDGRDIDPVPHVLWLRRVASAYARPSGAVTHLADVTARACAVTTTLREGQVLFQGKVLTCSDFLATWVVELAIHELDLVDGADPAGITMARRTVEALAGSTLPHDWDDRTATLTGLGRVPWPTAADQPPGFPVHL